MPRSIRFVTQNPVDPLSPCGAVITISCPRISQRNISTMQSAGTPARLYSIFGAPVLIVLAQCSEAIGPRRSCTSHGSMEDSVLLRASATPGPSSFPLILCASILTCCITTDTQFSPIQGLPRALVLVSTAAEPDRAYPQLARVVFGASLWYRSVQRRALHHHRDAE